MATVSSRRFAAAAASAALALLSIGTAGASNAVGSRAATGDPLATLRSLPALASSDSAEAAYAAASSCGVERWSVKTGTDPDAGLVDLSTSTATTVAALGAVPIPASRPADNRIRPQEMTQYRLSATLTSYKLETDQDYHLVIDDGAGHTMIAEIPDPACVGASSPMRPAIVATRQAFDARYTATSTFKSASEPVTVNGIGYFDYLHAQTGAAPNGIELHAITGLTFTQIAGGPSPSSPPPGSPSPSSPSPSSPSPGSPSPGQYAPITPSRFVDSRTGLGASTGRKTGTVTVTLPAAIPADAAGAVLNISVVKPAASGYLRVSPAGVATTTTAVNFSGGESLTELAVTAASATRQVDVSIYGGPIDLVIDAVGYYNTTGTTTAGGRYVPAGPTRFVDTRTGLGAPSGAKQGTVTITLPAQVPADATGVVLNISPVTPAQSGWLRLSPHGSPPTTTALNFTAGHSLTGLVLARADANRHLDVTVYGGPTQLVVDLAGYYDAAGTADGLYRAVSPTRFVDTRTGLGAATGLRTGRITVTLPDAVPAAEAAVVLNVSVVNPQGGGFLRVSPTGATPTTTALNFTAAHSYTGLVLATASPNRQLDLTVYGADAYLVVDLVGYQTAAAPPPAPPSGPGCAATVSNANPPAGSAVTVTVTTTAGASADAVAHYAIGDVARSGTANSSGTATVSFAVRDTGGSAVPVGVTTNQNGGASYCTTSFTPAAPSPR